MEAREFSAVQAAAAAERAQSGHAGTVEAIGSLLSGRRGPGMPGSAGPFCDGHDSRAAGFASAMPLDVAPGGWVLAQFAQEAAGDDERYPGVSDDELIGIISALDRVEANAGSWKHAAIGELIRRRPGEDGVVGEWDEFTPRELSAALAITTTEADDALALSAALETRLPGTRDAFRTGVISRYKAQIIAAATELLDPAEAGAAEAMVLDRAGRLTPPGLRAAIARAVMDVNPAKARKRREHAARQARVQRWAEPSGNAGLTGRELPPAEVLAADQRITSWAQQLRAAGMDGGMDLLRARAYLDILLGTDSRPGPAGPDGSPAGTREPVPAGTREPVPAGPVTGAIPPGFAGRVNLTIPLAGLIGRAGRPGELAGLGPVDPDLARTLATAAARNPKTTWCITVTDSQGHPIGHGCARPAPATPVARNGPGPPRPPGTGAFRFTPAGRAGPPGGYGAWILSTPGRSDLQVTIESLSTDPCQHRYQARGHDPGVMLRHLTEVRHATCTAPGCRRPAARCDYEHNTPYEAGGRTCLCNGNPTCRHDHRAKQHPKWHADQLPGGRIRWTTPACRHYTAEPTRYPI